MTARFLLGFFDSVYLLALTAWVGSLLFSAFGVAPMVSQVLGEEAEGRFSRAFLPRYSMWGAVSGAIALPASLGVPLSFPEFRGPMVAVQALTILAGTLLMLYAGNSLAPALDAARDAGPAGTTRLARLKRRLAWIDTLVLVLGLGLLIAFANRPAPRTSGIVEPDPVARARAAYERANAEAEGRSSGARRPR